VKKLLKAFGLVEVLIAIAVSGVVMVGAVQVSAKTLRQIKENELRDSANGVLLQSLEIARSPVEFRVLDLLGTANEKKFRLGTKAGSSASLTLIETSYAGNMSTCSETAEIRVTTADPNFVLCNLITIKDVTAASDKQLGLKRTFEVHSQITYMLSNKTFTDELYTYRTEIVPVTGSSILSLLEIWG
jgi:prepilin-type N-terminal cleavage/methylation domain-containing protein